MFVWFGFLISNSFVPGMASWLIPWNWWSVFGKFQSNIQGPWLMPHWIFISICIALGKSPLTICSLSEASFRVLILGLFCSFSVHSLDNFSLFLWFELQLCANDSQICICNPFNFSLYTQLSVANIQLDCYRHSSFHQDSNQALAFRSCLYSTLKLC